MSVQAHLKALKPLTELLAQLCIV